MAVPAIPDAGKPWLTWAQGIDTEARKVTDKADATDPRLTDTRTPTDGTVTNAKVASGAAISADKLADGTTNKVLTAAERTKLAGVATGATANSADATLLSRANHTGTQAASTITGLATVATSGAYADLSNKPTIPAATTDASQLTSGTLPIARIADGAVTAAKVAADVATQAKLDSLKAGTVAVVVTNGVPSTARPTGVGSVYWIASGGATNAQPQDIVYDPSAADTSAALITRMFVPASQMQVFYGATTYNNTSTGTQATLLDPNTNTALIFTTDPGRMTGWATFDAFLITENDSTGTGVARMNLTRMAEVAVGGTFTQTGQINYGDVSLTAGAQNVRTDIQVAANATVPPVDSAFSWVLTRKAADALDTLAGFIGIVGVTFVKKS